MTGRTKRFTMENKNKNTSVFFIILGCAIILILTGLLLPFGLKIISVEASGKALYVFQAAFIISGIFDIWLAFYTKDKLG